MQGGLLVPSSVKRNSHTKCFQVSDRARYLVMQHRRLRYILELALAGMKHGPGIVTSADDVDRLDLLCAYKQEWPALNWTHEHRMTVPTPCRVGVSGGFLHEIWNTSA